MRFNEAKLVSEGDVARARPPSVVILFEAKDSVYNPVDVADWAGAVVPIQLFEVWGYQKLLQLQNPPVLYQYPFAVHVGIHLFNTNY